MGEHRPPGERLREEHRSKREVLGQSPLARRQSRPEVLGQSQLGRHQSMLGALGQSMLEPRSGPRWTLREPKCRLGRPGSWFLLGSWYIVRRKK